MSVAKSPQRKVDQSNASVVIDMLGRAAHGKGAQAAAVHEDDWPFLLSIRSRRLHELHVHLVNHRVSRDAAKGFWGIDDVLVSAQKEAADPLEYEVR